MLPCHVLPHPCQRRSFSPSILILALVLLLPMAAPGTAAAAGSSGVIIAHMFPEKSLPGLGAEILADGLRRQGNFGTIDVAFAARLGDERENLRQLQRGEIDMAIVGSLALSYLTPRYRLANLPFLFENPNQSMAFFDTPIGREIRAGLKKLNLVVLSWHCVGSRLLTANRPIRSLNDLAGLRLRLPPDGVWMTTWKGLGANPRAVPFTELYDNLKRGAVDAQENPPNFIRAKKFYEVQSHLMLSNHLVQMQFILASRSFYESLKQNLRTQVTDAARHASGEVCRQARAGQTKDVEWLVNKGGMTVVELDLTAEADQALPRVAEQLDGPDGVKLLTLIKEQLVRGD